MQNNNKPPSFKHRNTPFTPAPTVARSIILHAPNWHDPPPVIHARISARARRTQPKINHGRLEFAKSLNTPLSIEGADDDCQCVRLRQGGVRQGGCSVGVVCQRSGRTSTTSSAVTEHSRAIDNHRIYQAIHASSASHLCSAHAANARMLTTAIRASLNQVVKINDQFGSGIQCDSCNKMHACRGWLDAEHASPPTCMMCAPQPARKQRIARQGRQLRESQQTQTRPRLTGRMSQLVHWLSALGVGAACNRT